VHPHDVVGRGAAPAPWISDRIRRGQGWHPDAHTARRAQVGPYNIRVNCIAPETILTARNLIAIPDALQAQMAAAHPLKRLGVPDDIARAALFLASSESDWITGAILDVSGGAVMTK
jgi:NAD(P)-dependent dehydrogenase (short-subunit alcohol dehydrogenase family)